MTDDSDIDPEDTGALIRAAWRRRVRGEFGHALHHFQDYGCQCPACEAEAILREEDR